MIPSPMLTYHFWTREDRPEAAPIVGDGPPLYDVHEVSASISRGFHVVATGRMRTRAGNPGPRRCRTVDLSVPQPEWLEVLMADARRRLTETED